MKPITLLSTLLTGTLVSLAQQPAWTFVQSSYYDNYGHGLACTASGCVASTGSNCSLGTATCAPNMRLAVQPGDVLIPYSAVYTSSGASVVLTTLSGEILSACPQCTSSTLGVTQGLDFVPSANGNESNFTCTFSTSNNVYQGCGVIELSTTYTSVSLDTGGASMAVCGTSCAGIPLTTTASDAIVQTIFPYSDYAAAMSSPYNAVCDGSSAPNCSGIGVAMNLNTSIGPQSTPYWLVGSNESVQMNVIALRGSSGNGGGGGPQWTFVQEGYWSNFGAASGPGGSNCGAPLVGTFSCTVNLSQPITPGNLIVVFPLFYSGDVITLTGISGETITICQSCRLLNSSAIMLDAGYVLHANGGENQITCYFSNATTGWQGCAVIEAHWSGSSVTFDTGGAALVSCGVNCPGINLSLSGGSDLVIQSNFPFYTNPLSVSSPYIFFQGSYGFDINATSGGAPIWTLPQADPATSNNAIAFAGH